MDIGPLKDFIEGLSKISRVEFEIRTPKGPLFFYGKTLEEISSNHESESLSKKIFKEKTFQTLRKPGHNALFGIPILNGEGVSGSLIARGSGLDAICESDMKGFLTEMAALFEDKWRSQREMEKMSEEMTRGFESLYLYSRVATKVRTLNFTNHILKDLIEDLIDTMRIDLAFSRLPDREEYNVSVVKKGTINDPDEEKTFIGRLLSAIPDSLSTSEKTHFVVNDSRQDALFRGLHPDPFRFLAVKIQHMGADYGWLGMASFNLKEIFRRSELSLLSWMAEQMAVVIANTDLYRDLERFVVNVVKSLVHAIEAKDRYTRGHSERVHQYCMMVAEHLDLEKGARNDLHWASLLHDVGKIGIPENILNKPGRLTDEEYAVIKGHPRKGHDILKPIEQLSNSLPGILHHHERIDGRGYPDGLAGKDIPLVARIIAVSDTFDAITSNRAYRDAGSYEKALSIMDEVAGSQLDRRLVQVFMGVFREKIQKGGIMQDGG